MLNLTHDIDKALRGYWVAKHKQPTSPEVELWIEILSRAYRAVMRGDKEGSRKYVFGHMSGGASTTLKWLGIEWEFWVKLIYEGFIRSNYCPPCLEIWKETGGPNVENLWPYDDYNPQTDGYRIAATDRSSSHDGVL